MGRREIFEEQKLKKLVYIFSITLVISIIIFITLFTMYNKKLKEQSRESLTELGKMNNIVSNDELEETSFSSDLTVAKTTNTFTPKVSTNNTTNTSNNSSSSKKSVKNVTNKTPVEAAINNTTNIVNNSVSNEIKNEIVEMKKELTFMAPVSGEIIKDFATDTLVFSNTLEEWTTHSGIDIKADKTTVVVASEAGKVESIKNDPRYGLTVTIAHENGFKTVYSNLLTTEFVKETEVVEKGQTIATVGESASFEVADESHLHFEVYKDGTAVNPTIYLKDV